MEARQPGLITGVKAKPRRKQKRQGLGRSRNLVPARLPPWLGIDPVI